MHCIACQTDNSPKAKFCKGCGMMLAAPPGAYSKEALRRCEACKVVVAQDANFCNSCGHDLGAAPAAMSPSSSEKRSARRRNTLISSGFAAMAVVVAAAYIAYIGDAKPRMELAIAKGITPAAQMLKVHAEQAPVSRRWLLALRNDLRRCEREAWYAQPICTQRAVFRYCGPDHWGTVPECPQSDIVAEQ
jgi:hypothetical protein